MNTWHIITPEYPPQPGGVSDYVLLIASRLAAAGDEVHVWCPFASCAVREVPGVHVHRELGRFALADLRRAGRLLERFPCPRRLFVQWVPQGYGYRSMNLAICLWLWHRAVANHDHVDIMVHEPFLPLKEGSWKWKSAAVVHRFMTIILLRAARRVWYSTPAWEACWRPYAFRRRIPFTWLPLPSNVTPPLVQDPESVHELRARYIPPSSLLIGHFGTFGRQLRELLRNVLHGLLDDLSDCAALLIGPGGGAMRDELIAEEPTLAGRVYATGAIPVSQLSPYLLACDVMLQPYPDGVTSRRTTLMACLAFGRPTVATDGDHTEPFWATSGAIALVPVLDTDAFVAATRGLLLDPRERQRMGEAARAFYQERFDVRHIIDLLRKPDS